MIPSLVEIRKQILAKDPKLSLEDCPGLVGYWACEWGLPLPPRTPEPEFVAGLTNLDGWQERLAEHTELGAAHDGWRERHDEFMDDRDP